MNMTQWISELRRSPVKKALPILSFPSISLMKVSVRDLISSSSLQAEGMKLIADRVDSAASVSVMDLSVEAEAFGSAVRFSDDEAPTIMGSIIQTRAQIETLRVPEVGSGRTGLYVDAIGKAVKLITDRPVFAGVIGPFSLAGRLINVLKTLEYCVDEQEMVYACLSKTTDFLIAYIRAYKEIGAHGVVIAEPLAGLLSPRMVEKFSCQSIKEIVDCLQDDSFSIIYHNCGNNTIQQSAAIFNIGAAAYHFGNAISMPEMLRKAPSDCLIMGNLDPVELFKNGTPETTRQATLKLMEECCPAHSNFVISSGCDIPPLSNWENIDAFFAAVSEYYGRK